MADLRNKLTIMISEIEGIRFPETDAESIDAALAEHEDRKAAIQIQKDILMSLEAGLPKNENTSGEESFFLNLPPKTSKSLFKHFISFQKTRIHLAVMKKHL